MFPKKNRFDLRAHRDFFQTSKRQKFPFFQIYYQSAPETQFAVVVPKKVSKSSTKRHKLLRQMRHILMQNRTLFVQKQVVVVMFLPSLGKSFFELNEMVIKAAQHLK